MLQPSQLRSQDLCDAAWVEGVGLGTNRRAAPCAVAKVGGHNLPSWQSIAKFLRLEYSCQDFLFMFVAIAVQGLAGSHHKLLGICSFLLSFTLWGFVILFLLLFLFAWSHCRCSTLNPSLALCDARVALPCSHGSLSLSYVIAWVKGLTF